MTNRENDRRGAQAHAEGEYGSRAREGNRERLHRTGDDDTDGDTAQTRDAGDAQGSAREGKHRIYEDRQQHDEADKNSEKNRLNRDRDREDTTPRRLGRESR